MAVKRHGSKWRADWRDEFHRRHRKDFDLKAEAEAHEREMLQGAREGTGAAPTCDPDIRLSEYAKHFLSKRGAQGIDPGTVARQEIDLRRHVLPRFGTTKVREVGRPAVRSLLLALLAEDSAQGVRAGSVKRTRKTLARGSVRNVYHTLSAILSEAVEDSLIKSNPIRGLWKSLTKGKARHEERELVKALTADQASAFLAAAETNAPEHYRYFCTLMLAGLRPGEGLALTADKLNFRDRSILVDCQIGQHGGLKSTKTGQERTVDLSRQLAAILGDARQAERPDSSAKVISISGVVQGQRALGPWLFYPELGPTPTEKDAQRVYKNALRTMRRCLLSAGLPAHFGLHSLRHTFGSGLVSRGVSPVYVQQQMGHASIEQTVGVYGSWFPARVPGAVDTLGDALLGRLGHSVNEGAACK